MKKFLLLTLLLCPALCPALLAQETDPVLSIDNQAIMRGLDKSVPAMAAALPEAGLNHLLGHISSQLQDGLKPAVPKVGTTKLTPEDLYTQCSQGVLMFGNYYDCGQCDRMHVGVGASAVALTADGICMTNYHVMEDIIRKNREALQGDSLYYVGTLDGKTYPVAEVLAYSRANDLAIFRVDTRGERLNPLPLGEPLATGARVHVISHPKQLFYYYTQGVVARNSKYSRPDREALYRMDITADFAIGSSGGAILDDYGRVVGMVASTTSLYFDDEKKAPQQMVVKSTIPVRAIKASLNL